MVTLKYDICMKFNGLIALMIPHGQYLHYLKPLKTFLPIFDIQFLFSFNDSTWAIPTLPKTTKTLFSIFNPHLIAF